MNSREFRNALGRFATGVTVVTVDQPEGGVHGMTANSFTSVSLDPPLILVCVAHRARLLELLRDAERFGVGVLGEDQQQLSDYFARTEQSEDIAFLRTARGTPLLDGCLATFECRTVAAHLAGDHTIFVGEVEEFTYAAGRPLLYVAGRYGKVSE